MAAPTDRKTTEQQLQAYYADIAKYSVAPLWEVLDALLPPEPHVHPIPYRWSWKELRPEVLRAGELIAAAKAERRVLMLLNPGMPRERAACTSTLYAGLQLILPGEIARTHRHTAAAIRFIIEGKGAYTTVEGEQTVMEVGDFVLTPNWTWHDHGNESTQPMVWLDVLDLPLLSDLEAIFYQQYPSERQPITKPIDDSRRTLGSGGLLPTYAHRLGLASPLLNYTWRKSRETLTHLARGSAGSPHDGILLEYTNPYTGGPAMPTIGCYIQLLTPGQHTTAHQHTGSAIYHVASGQGYSVVSGIRMDWAEKDVFVVPSWAMHEHVNTGPGEAILFSATDLPVIRPLGLYRERELTTGGGHQEITHLFQR